MATRKSEFTPPKDNCADIVRLLRMLMNRLEIQATAARDSHHEIDLHTDADACAFHIKGLETDMKTPQQTSNGAAMANDPANIGVIPGLLSSIRDLSSDQLEEMSTGMFEILVDKMRDIPAAGENPIAKELSKMEGVEVTDPGTGFVYRGGYRAR